ncbi:hypothetical protein H4W31_004142 [Plantactinospora soyae]|uniref:Uncharacterized protein n=1 Tax=Plantactinospora soyae TaxID=1544732 RepID=A0A927R6J4_9ACTN|nr:hypothetical protein [Plantactinospora soyae]
MRNGLFRRPYPENAAGFLDYVAAISHWSDYTADMIVAPDDGQEPAV